ncbi:tetratricopeptide repeat protein [Planctomycetota bacterium]
MAKPRSCFVVLIVLLMPMAVPCSKREAAIDSFNRGVEASDEGDHDLAITCFTVAIRLNPGLVEAYYNRGFAYLHKGDLDKAVADFTEAIRLNPEVVEAYNNRGIAYEKNGDKAKAEADFAKAKELGYEPE